MSKTFIELMDDMHLSNKDTFMDFYIAMKNNNIGRAQSILDNNPDVANQIMNSENINYLIDILNARELEPKTDIDYFLKNLYQLFLKMINDTKIVGEYDTNTQYYIHNFVLYQNKYYYALKTPPIGTVPTNKEYWMEYDIKGFQGYGGITNLNYLGNWDSTINYKPYDVVIYQNRLWYAIDNNISYPPNLNHYPWNPIIFPAQPVKTPIQKEKPLTGYSEGDFWFQITQGDEIIQASWDTLQPDPMPRYAASSFMIENMIYIIGGTYPNFTISNTVEAYDITTNTWSTKASYPAKLDALGTFALNGLGYCVGGQNSIEYIPSLYSKSVYSYNPATNIWTQKNDFPIEQAGVNEGVIAQGKAYIVGDIIPNGISNEIYVYDEANDSWSLETNVPALTTGKYIAAIGDKIYIMGGFDPTGVPLKSNYIYDITTKTWTTGKELNTARAYGGTFTNNGSVYLVGGFNDLSYSSSLVEKYNTLTNNWNEEVSMTYARNSLCTENTDTYGYAIGGINIMQPMIAGYVERYAFTPGYSSFDMTIDTSLGDNTISIPMTSSGTYNYYIDWGDGISSSQITTYSDTNATHTYSEAKEYKIKLYGTLNALLFQNTNIGKCLKEITKCSLSFIDIKSMFENCLNLTYIPDDIFSYSSDLTSAMGTFKGCSNLSVIPGNLFINNPEIYVFNNTFQDSGIITIPTNLFSSISKASNFTSTFNGCSKLTAIPRNLFYNNTKAIAFQWTFFGCSELETIPDNLFSNNNETLNYTSVFQNCSKLSSIPGNIFGNANGSVTAYSNAFSNTNISELPDGLFRYANNVKYYDGVFEKTISGLNPITKIPDFFFNGDDASYLDAFDITKIKSLGQNSLNGLNIASDMFKNKTELQTVGDDVFWAKGTTSLINNPTELLSGCSGLETLGNMDFTAVPSTVDLNTIFSGCILLSNISGFKTVDNKPSLSHNISFTNCPLTHESLVNLIDSLKTLSSDNEKALTLGDINLGTLTDTEKLVIINKYWTLPGWTIDFDSRTAAELVQYLYGNDSTNTATDNTTDDLYAVRLYDVETTTVIDWYAVNRHTGMVSLFDEAFEI